MTRIRGTNIKLKGNSFLWCVISYAFPAFIFSWQWKFENGYPSSWSDFAQYILHGPLWIIGVLL